STASPTSPRGRSMRSSSGWNDGGSSTWRRSRHRRAHRARSTRSTTADAHSSTSSGRPGASSQNALNSSEERDSTMAKWYELVTGSLEEKKRYKDLKARQKALPDGYRTAAE